MKGSRRGVSAGTVLALALTAAVLLGCVAVFARIQGGNPAAQMSAQKVMGLVGDALQGATPVPEIQSTVPVVTVTLAPAPAATAAPSVRVTRAPGSGSRRSFSVTVGGLLAFESDISDSVYDKTDRRFDYAPILAGIRARVDGDLTLVSLPQVVNAQDQKYADGLIPSAALDGVRASGFEYLLLNSAHALDQGIEGVNQTAQALAQAGFTGVGVTAGSAQQHRVIHLNGVQIALLTYTESLTAKGRIARESQPEVMTLFSMEQAKKDIAAARQQGAEFVIVSVYWGKEDTSSPTTAMKNTAYALAEAGADLILGCRPSRVLPVETVSVPDDNGVQRLCLIVYSMGTLLGESREGYNISGMLLHLNVSCENGRTEYGDIAYSPTYIWRSSANGKARYRVVCPLDTPEEMDTKQKDVMDRALRRIQNTMKDGPAIIRN